MIPAATSQRKRQIRHAPWFAQARPGLTGIAPRPAGGRAHGPDGPLSRENEAAAARIPRRFQARISNRSVTTVRYMAALAALLRAGGAGGAAGEPACA